MSDCRLGSFPRSQSKLLYVSCYKIPPFSFSPVHIICTEQASGTQEEATQGKSYILKVWEDTRRPLVTDNMLHNVLLRNIISILLVDKETM